ncbi:MAG: plasmid mobilization relaxosome protein MobC [Hyphomicrobiaceae bacterium]
MGRRRTHDHAPRSKTVTIRLTEDEYQRRAADARAAGLTVSGLCERLVRDGCIEVRASAQHRPMDPALFAELRRIGNNANQIAHAINGNLPPATQLAWQTVSDLLRTLMRDEMLAQQIQALRTRTQANDPPPPQARPVFQRSVHIYPARPGQKDD